MLLQSDFNSIAKTYEPLGRMIGTETEHLVTHNNGAPITVETADLLGKSYGCEGVNFSREIFAGVFESKTNAYHPQNIADLCNANDAIHAQMTEIARSHHLLLSKYGFDPDLTLQQAFNYRVPHPRADKLLGRLQEDGYQDIAKHCLMTTSVHVSLGYETLDTAWRIANMASRMTPLLTLLTENNHGRLEGQENNHHVMGMLRHAQGDRTNIQRYFYDAANGKDFVERHMYHISHVPAMMYMNSNRKAQIFPNFKNRGLSDLVSTGLANRDNYFLIEKMQYNDVKLAAILDEDQQVTGHRIELRMADRGVHQHDSMVIIAAMMMDDKTVRQLDGMLARFGYDKNDPQCYDHVYAGLNAAIYHGGQHLKQTMHSGASFHEMAQELGLIVKDYVSSSPAIAQRAEKLLSICRTGVNEAQFNKDKQKRGLIPL